MAIASATRYENPRSALARWRSSEPTGTSAEWSVTSEGSTLRGVLDAVFEKFPTLGGYVLDERGSLRHHIVVFIDGEPLADKRHGDVAVNPESEIHIFQALSGG